MASELSKLRHDSEGGEQLDTTPIAIPSGIKKQPSLFEQINQAVRLQKLRDADGDPNNIEETDEEADDFEVGEDFEPLSPHENDHIPSIKVLKERVKEINAEIEKRARAKAAKEYKDKHGQQTTPKKEGGVSPPPNTTTTTSQSTEENAN